MIFVKFCKWLVFGDLGYENGVFGWIYGGEGDFVKLQLI